MKTGQAKQIETNLCPPKGSRRGNFKGQKQGFLKVLVRKVLIGKAFFCSQMVEQKMAPKGVFFFKKLEEFNWVYLTYLLPP